MTNGTLNAPMLNGKCLSYLSRFDYRNKRRSSVPDMEGTKKVSCFGYEKNKKMVRYAGYGRNKKGSGVPDMEGTKKGSLCRVWKEQKKWSGVPGMEGTKKRPGMPGMEGIGCSNE